MGMSRGLFDCGLFGGNLLFRTLLRSRCGLGSCSGVYRVFAIVTIGIRFDGSCGQHSASRCQGGGGWSALGWSAGREGLGSQESVTTHVEKCGVVFLVAPKG